MCLILKVRTESLLSMVIILSRQRRGHAFIFVVYIEVLIHIFYIFHSVSASKETEYTRALTNKVNLFLARIFL